MVDNTRFKALSEALKKTKNRHHTIVQWRKTIGEFSIQRDCHKLFQTIFAGYPVEYEAMENSIPLGGYKVIPGDDKKMREFKYKVNEDIRAAQGKMTSKGCIKYNPDYQIEWRDKDNHLQAIRIEFKKLGEQPTPEQKARHKELLATVKIPTEIVHSQDEAYAVVQKYNIPNRGRGLF